MPRSRKRKKKIKNKKGSKKKHKPYEAVKINFVQYENPFPADIPFEARLEVLLEIGRRSESSYKEEFARLTNYLKDYDPLYLCAFSSFYFVAEEEGMDREAIDGHLEFPPFYLEVLQCLALTMERAISAKPLNDQVENFKSTVQNLNTSLGQSYFNLAKGAKSQEDIGAIMLRSEMMMRTLAVRNWAYIHQMNQIAFELASFLDSSFSKAVGFTPDTLLIVLFAIAPILEEKINDHLRRVRSFVTPKNFNQVYDNYENAFPEVTKTEKSQRKALWERFGKDTMVLKGLLMAHSDLFLEEAYTVEVDEVHEYLLNKVSKDEISKVLNCLSLRFGELSQINQDYIFLDNPVHTKPLVKLEDDRYFSGVPHLLSHISVEVIESLLPNNQKIRDQYLKKKGKYLENKVEELFKKSFPKSQVFAGSLWNDGEKEYENDLIVIIEDFAIIIECKSGGVSAPAKRGAPERLFKTIKELVIEPSQQAIRFQTYLKQNVGENTFKTKSGESNMIITSNIKYYIPLGITLSNLGSIGCNLKKLISARITSLKLEELAPSISYTDLEVIFEILSYRAEKIHYLARRREFEAHMNFQGDEIDLFGFYLDHGFNIGETEYDESSHINLTLKSKEIDPYFIGKNRNVSVQKPELKKSKYWGDLLKKIDSLSEKSISSSFILLNMPIEDQQKFQKNLKKLKSMVLNNEFEKEHNYIQMNFGPERRHYAIVGYAYKDISIETRNGVINDISSSLASEKKLRGYLILGFDLNSTHYPYSFLVGDMETRLFDELDL